MPSDKNTRASEPPAGPIGVFVSYSHTDELLHDLLAKHLKPLEREGLIQSWHDRKISPGREFATEIDNQLNRARIILLLVSPDFISSEYCWGKEMTLAMDRHEAGDARVIPVILRPVDWHYSPFGMLLALPKDGKPVTTWTHPDEAFLDVARGIRAAVGDLNPNNGVTRLKVAASIPFVAYTTDYRAVVATVDLENHEREAQQITQISLEMPSLATVLQHAPGPPNLIGDPWLPQVPFSIEPKKLTRGRLFFSAGAGPLREGLPEEPLRARLRFRFFSGFTVEQEMDIHSFDTLRQMNQGTASSGDLVSEKLSPAEKIRAATQRREEERAEHEKEQQRRTALEQAALQGAPKEFDAMAEMLQSRGNALKDEKLPGVPELKYEPVNHRLDAGTTYSIELSPYAQMQSYTAIVRIGLHPNAHQSHVELPNIKAISRNFRACVDEEGFHWLDDQGRKWMPEEIIDFAIDRFTDLLASEPDFTGSPYDNGS